jgi:hypothetical protein
MSYVHGVILRFHACKRKAAVAAMGLALDIARTSDNIVIEIMSQ